MGMPSLVKFLYSLKPYCIHLRHVRVHQYGLDVLLAAPRHPNAFQPPLKPTALAALTLATIESSGLLQKKSQTKSSGPNSLASLIVIKLRFSSVMSYGYRLKSDTWRALQFCSTGLREFSTNIWISPSIFFLKGPRTLKPAEVTTFAERSWAHSVRPFNDFSGLIS